MKDSVRGKRTIQVPHQILILPPCGYFTMIVSQFSVGCLPSSVSTGTMGSVKITQKSMAFCLALQRK